MSIKTNSNQIRFSVIVPIYNVEKYIAKCLDSLLAQKYAPYEILVIDDAGKDKSVQIAQDYADKYDVIKLLHQENKGLGATRNVGVEAASGDYIVFLDGDDAIDENLLLDCAEVLAKRPFPVVYFGFEWCFEGNEAASRIGDEPPLVTGRDVLEGKEIEDLFKNDAYRAWQGVYSREFLLQNDIKNGEGYFYEDAVFFAKVFLCAKSVFILHKPYYKYLIRSDSISHDISEGFEEKRIEGRERAMNAVGEIFKAYNASEFVRLSFINHEVHDCTEYCKQEERYPEELRTRYRKAVLDFCAKFVPIKFSVIVPAYNVEKYLARCLDSLLVQKYPLYEIIVIDDGATDETAKIAEEYATKYGIVKLIRQENKGLGATRNVGIKAASGDYVVFVDSDDFVEPELTKLCASQIEEAAWDIVFFDYSWHYDNGVKVRQETIPKNLYELNIFENMDCEKLLFIPNFMVWLGAYRREMLLKNDVQNGEGYFFEDIEFTIDAILSAKRITAIPRALYNYYMRDDSILRKETEEHARARIEGWIFSMDNVWRVAEKHKASDFACSGILNHAFDTLYRFYTNIDMSYALRNKLLEKTMNIFARYSLNDLTYLREDLRKLIESGAFQTQDFLAVANALFEWGLRTEKNVRNQAQDAVAALFQALPENVNDLKNAMAYATDNEDARQNEYCIESRWYFDFGTGMSENIAEYHTYPIDLYGNTSQSILVRKGCKILRWDPVELPCVLQDLRIWTDEDEAITPINIRAFAHKNALIFPEPDPQVFVDFGEGLKRDTIIRLNAKVRTVYDAALMQAFAELYERKGRKRKWFFL